MGACMDRWIRGKEEGSMGGWGGESKGGWLDAHMGGEVSEQEGR